MSVDKLAKSVENTFSKLINELNKVSYYFNDENLSNDEKFTLLSVISEHENLIPFLMNRKFNKNNISIFYFFDENVNKNVIYQATFPLFYANQKNNFCSINSFINFVYSFLSQNLDNYNYVYTVQKIFEISGLDYSEYKESTNKQEHVNQIINYFKHLLVSNKVTSIYMKYSDV